MRVTLLTAASLLALTAVPVSAQTGEPTTGTQAQRSAADSDGDATIVVTARRVEENLQDVPVSITAFGQETIKERAIAN